MHPTSWGLVADGATLDRLGILGIDPASLAAPVSYESRQAVDRQCFCVLLVENGQLRLQPVGAGSTGPVLVDFSDGKSRYRRTGNLKKQELLVKAVLGKKAGVRTLVDATAGLGRDSFVLACAGLDVIAIERQPIVAALLQDGLFRGLEQPELRPILERVCFKQGNARTLLHTVPRCEVIYIDPMFPERAKSALVKKEMRVFQQLDGEDEDSPGLIETALQVATRKVVVKRPRKGEVLGSLKPSYSQTGRSSRFDVYMVTAPQV